MYQIYHDANEIGDHFSTTWWVGYIGLKWGFKSMLLDTQNVKMEVIYTEKNVPRVLLIFLTALTTVRLPPKFQFLTQSVKLDFAV